jgi:hypothetical protein
VPSLSATYFRYSHTVFGSIGGTGVAGLEPATYGFGDRRSTN